MPVESPALPAAVGALYAQHSSWLHGWLRKRMGSHCDAADLVQDTFVQLLKTRTSLEIRAPRQYLSTVAKGLMIDLFRRRSLEQAYMETLASIALADIPSAEAQAIMFETLVELDRMLAGLGAKVREVFILSQLEGLPYAQIATRLDISLRSVNNHMAKAMEHVCLMQWESVE